MLGRLKNLYDIDAIPGPIRLLAEPLGMALALPFLAQAWISRWTVRHEIRGDRRWLAEPGVILCHWHEAIPAAMSILEYEKVALLFHPKWYMLPIYRLFQGLGCRTFVLGSSGHRGRRAAERLALLIAQGYRTVITPDGPAGPPKQVKPGIFQLARDSGAPVVALRFSCRRRLVSRDWDAKYFPLPWARMEIEIRPPLFANDFGDASAFVAALAASLGP